MAGPAKLLKGVRVVDLSRIIAGPWASQILSDFGAEVVKVERPGIGDDARSYIRGSIDGVEVSPIFVALNSGKKSIALDLSRPAGVEALLRIVEVSDVFLHNFRPGVAERLGLDEPSLRARNEGLIYCAISGFGEEGPLKDAAGNDVAGQAYGGVMSILGHPDSPPIRCPIQLADITAGYNAAIGILASLVGRNASGRGTVVRTSLFESILGLMGQYFTDLSVTGVPMGRLGSRTMNGQPNQAFRSLDGFVVIAATGDDMWKRCVEALGHPELQTDKRFLTNQARVAHQEELAEAVEQVTARATTRDLLETLRRANVVAVPILTIEDLVHDPQALALGMHSSTSFADVPVGSIASPLRVDDIRPEREVAPRLGEHTAGVLAQFGYSAADIAAM